MTKKTFKRIFLSFVALYFVILAARAVYDLITFEDTDIARNANIYYTGEKEDSSLRNYASQKMEYDSGGSMEAMEQKYERIANLVAKTVRYDEDLGRLQGIIAENSAVIQMENSRGLAGSRRVDLVIGVRPERFDQMHAQVSAVGRITSTSATITDKTYEYRQMLSEKETLERRLASYQELKEQTGSVTEMLMLEERIIEVEAQIQEQMIGLGEYSDDNALCTINFTLYEGSEAGVLRKLWNALIWSTTIYFLFLLGLCLVAFGAFLLAAIWSYLKKVLVDKPQGSADAPPAAYPEPPQPPDAE